MASIESSIASARPPAVVMGLSPTGLYAVRELGRASIEVTGVAPGWQAGHASRYLGDCLTEPAGQDRLEAMLKRFPAEGTKPVLIPTSDEDIAFIVEHKATLEPRFAIQKSYLDGAADIMLSKERFYARCDELGIAYPRFWKCSPSDLMSLKNEVRYPCLIKPSKVHEAKALMAGKKGWVAKDAAAFEKLAREIPLGAGLLLLQEIVPGPESEITLYAAYFDQQGQPRQTFTGRKLRQYPPGFGSASLVCSQSEPETQAIAERLLQAVGYQGIAAAEFKKDPRDGQLKIIEVNARPSLWFSLSTAAGKSMSLAAYHDLAQTGETVPERSQINGIRWRYAFKDLYSAWFYKTHSDFVLPAPNIPSEPTPKNHVYAVYADDDRAPVSADWRNMAKKMFRPLVARMKQRKS
jgi:D-aspartate ligase